MPYVYHQDIRIHYQVAGSGEPLVLHHGFMQWLDLWHQLGYVKALKSHYQLVMLDARGHGASDKPHDASAYALPERVGDVLAVLDALHIDQAHYWGFSMGGRIGFGLAHLAPERVRSLIIGGAHPYEDSFRAFDKIDGTDADAFIHALESVMEGEKLSPTARALVLKNDLQALAAAAQSRESLEAHLPNMHMPFLIYSGDQDFRYKQAKQCTKQLPNAHFVGLTGLNHAASFVHSADILPHALTHLRKQA